MKSRTITEKLLYGVEVVFLIAWVAFSLIAFAWIVISSFKTNPEFFGSMLNLPAKLEFDNYRRALSGSGLGIDALNSIIVVGVAIVLLLIVATPASYVLARYDLPGLRWITTGFILGVGVPMQVLIIPLFFILLKVKLVNTLTGLVIVYVVTSLPFTVFLLRGFFLSLPSEVEEAATIDGCSAWGVFRRVMLPLARGGLITATIFNVVFMLNDFLLALTLIQDNDKYTLSLGLFGLHGNMRYTGDWVGLFAGFTIIMLPSLVVYLLLSRQLIEGVTMGATKG